ncbi:hypothetical protein FRC09_016684 [Ceratobasidium sp. 395]|nr:hypothetical protein FRC09_016684 [Ceratobasidium sp. 395]
MQQTNTPPTPGTCAQPATERLEPPPPLPNAPPPDVGPYDHTRSSLQASTLPAPPTAGQSAKRERWARLKALADVLVTAFKCFEPLKQAAEVIEAGVETFEMADQNRTDYEKLRKDLNKMFHDLAEFFDASTPPVMAPTVANFAQEIDRELEAVRLKLSETRIGTYRTDTDEIPERYRNIQNLLQRVTSNVSFKILQIADEQATENRLGRLPYSPAAKYSSADSSDLRGRCTQNTRVQVLEDIHEWACNDKNSKVYWLNGMAGTGKTTIAYSLCERLERSKKLAASFFCSRQLPSCRDVNRIVPTISYQLTGFSRPFRTALSAVLGKKQDVHNQVLLEQFKDLVVNPLSYVKDALRTDLVVVIDALDECDNNNAVDRMLSALLSYARELPIKFFVASRPDAKILDRMRGQHGESIPTELRLHELDHPTVQKDIGTYLNARLQSHTSLSAASLNTLVERSGVLFIYASTVVRYLEYDNWSRADDRLEEILKVSEDSENDSEKDINDLYTVILEAALNNPKLTIRDKAEMKLVLDTVICAQEPLSIEAMAGLLELGTRKVQAALRPLFSVLHLSDMTGHTITTLHKSFPDYLLDKNRSGAFHCVANKHHAYLAQLCFKHIKRPNPPFNICNLESSYVLDKDVPDLPARIEKTISEQLVYACRYWVAHCMSAEVFQNLMSLLREFASERFLLWMEVMSLSGNVDEGVSTLGKAQKWSSVSLPPRDLRKRQKRFPGLSTLAGHIRECERAGQSTAKSLKRSASVASPDPKGGIICISYSQNGAYIVSGAGDKTVRIWDAHTGQPVGQPMKGHTSAVISVAYSPDGVYIVSGSDDRTIRIWDAHTGRPVGRSLAGHTDKVRSVAYSPTGAYIVSGSFDGTIRIWDAHTGQPVGIFLQAHDEAVLSVAYSPDGAYIVSGSADGTIRIWDTYTGQQVGQPWRGHGGSVQSVAYSPDGAHIVSGSQDNTVRIWDARTGPPVGKVLQGHGSYVYSVAYSPDGAYIVSGSSDSTIRVWNAHSGQPVGQSLQGHTDFVRSVACSPDSAYIVSGSDDKAIRVWNMRFILPSNGAPDINTGVSDMDSGRSQPAHSLPAISEPRMLCNLGCQVNCPHMVWEMNNDGWVVFDDSRLIWVPPDFRVTLLRPQNTALISTRGVLHLDLDRNKLGECWCDHFRPGRSVDL